MKKRNLDHSILMIAKALASAKQRASRRIVKQLQRMSPQDVTAVERVLFWLERLIGKR
mgnify:FL=1